MALHRHETYLMFAEFTVYLAATGLLVKDIICTFPEPQGLRLFLAYLFGLVLTWVFGVIHLRTRSHQRQAANRARELEKVLNYRLFSARIRGWIAASNAMLAYYVFCAVGCAVGLITAAVP